MSIQVFVLSRTYFLSFFFPSLNKGPTTFWKSAPPLGVRLLLHSYLLDSELCAKQVAVHTLPGGQVLKLLSPDPADLLLFCN